MPVPPRSRRPKRLGGLLSIAVLGLVAVAACSGGSDDAGRSTTSSVGSRVEGGSTATTEAPAAVDERIVVIGEEYLLADLLALGIEPVASTATLGDAGFHGIDQYDTSGIQPLPATEPNLELLGSLRPDRIIILEFFADQLGREVLDDAADVVTVVPDGLGPVELVELYGELFGREDRAAELVTEYEAAMDRAAEALDGIEVSVAAIYGGPSVAAFVDGPWAVPATLLDAGAALVPTPAEAEPDANGRAYLSLENLGLLSAPKLLLLQSSLVEGESAAVDTIEQNPLWSGLPAVEAAAVVELDRLGYPGIEGRTRLVDDLITALGPQR